MSKNNNCYSNTIIYKIYCKDNNITDTYVGHTTNFLKRKEAHKCGCKNLNNKVYKSIRENGGWNNWNMVEIAKYNCNNLLEARMKEQQHYEELNATLNSCPPYVDKPKHFCTPCNKQCMNVNQYNCHINSEQHIKNTNEEKDMTNLTTEPKTKKQASRFFCEKCNFRCYQKIDWDRHIIRPKHLGNKNKKKAEIKNTLSCDCGKKFETKSGLWKHKQKCKTKNDNKLSDKDIIKALLKIIENRTNNNNSNSHNNINIDNFNLNLYLKNFINDNLPPFG
jgi:hypothetical protein